MLWMFFFNVYRERYQDTMLEAFNYAYDVREITKVFEERYVFVVKSNLFKGTSYSFST